MRVKLPPSDPSSHGSWANCNPMHGNTIKAPHVVSRLHLSTQFCERSEEGRPPTAMPPARVAGHDQGPCRGGRVQSRAPQGWPHMARAACMGSRPRAWLAPARVAPTGTMPIGAAAQGAAMPIRPLGQRRLPQRGLLVGKAATRLG
ncbi:hypothetical protein GW17_00015178 [Ensete ventricosum]|nr:hypothetical protein GW17_00015178 [Ensete ventricosum]